MLTFFTTNMPPLHARHWQAWSIWLTILVFPFFAAGAEGGASYPFAWLVLIGLIYGWKYLPELTNAEKQLFIGFAIFIGVVALAVMFGNDLKEDLRRLDKYSAMLWAFPAYLGIRRFVKEPGRPLIGGLLLAPIGALMFGLDWDFSRILSALTLSSRLDGFYATIILSNIAGILTILLLAATILFFRHPATLLLGSIMVLLGIIVVIATASRTGMLFLPIGIVLTLFLLRRQLSKQHLLAVALSISAVLLVFILNPQNAATARTISAVETLFAKSDSDSSTTLRFEMWQDSILIWKKYPILGAGPGGYQNTVRAMQASGDTLSTHDFGHAHSIYFQALATMGTLGFIAMLWFAFFRPLQISWNFKKSTDNPWQLFYATGIILTVIAFLVFGLTEAWFSRNPMLRSYLLCLIILLAGMIQMTPKPCITSTKSNPDVQPHT